MMTSQRLHNLDLGTLRSFVTIADDAAFAEQSLIDHCAKGLAKYKVPIRVFPIDAFPTTKSANGTKIQKAKLREMAEENIS